jgi:hypothetical protein
MEKIKTNELHLNLKTYIITDDDGKRYTAKQARNFYLRKLTKN